MSAITRFLWSEDIGGVRRYRTRCKVRIDSHDQKDPIYVSDDVVQFQTGKTLKGGGQLNLTLVASKNYLNLIRPNDYVNLYVNIGDGEGWWRTFFGFVDRIVERYSVDKEGKPSTSYSIVATDFSKVLDKTQVYFNNWIEGRQDISGDFFGTTNIGGLALMSKGIQSFGSPADVVVNLLMIMLGFGTQFVLPYSYTAGYRDALRSRRAQFIQGRLAETARRAIIDAGNFQKLKEKIKEEEEGTASFIANSGASQDRRLKSLFKERGIETPQDQDAILHAAQAGDVDQVAALFADHRLKNQLRMADRQQGTDDASHAFDLLNATLPEAADSFLDVMDTFSFIERTAIDGYYDHNDIWTKQGTLMNIIRGYTNEIVNEFFLDLRPVSQASVGEAARAEYSRQPDEIEENVGDDGEADGVMFVPAVVMREYPWSTIDGLDFRGKFIEVEEVKDEIGIVPLGEVFAVGVNEPGRHAAHIPNINIADIRLGKGSKLASKHIDVAVVYDSEIIKSEFGRSDHELYNFSEITSDGVTGKYSPIYLRTLMPIITPVHVMRHGLRVRSLHTRAARFNLTVANRLDGAQDPEATEETQASEEAAEPVPVPVVASGDLIAPVRKQEGARYRFGRPPSNRWGYRERRPASAPHYWQFHQGIDIIGNAQTPVYAIADGEVVASAPDGLFNGYGNHIILRHDFGGEVLYSAYSHLSKRLVGPDLSVDSVARRSSRRKWCVSGCGVARGAMEPIPVSKGDVIGYVGATHLSFTNNMGAHLHFEINRRAIPRDDTLTPRYLFEDPPGGWDPGNAHYADERVPAGEVNRPSPPSGDLNSLDPIEFYASNGIDLEASINEGETVEDGYEGEPDDDDQGNMDDEDKVIDPVVAKALSDDPPENASATAGAKVDTSITRIQLVRWAMLQDHWYQHNLEYLSGRIEMRGAPEIRVGYRLDLYDRNLSFYVESVNHQWRFPDKMVTVLQVTRGQPNNPFPMYVLPPLDAFDATDTQRSTGSGRLSKYFLSPDPLAVRRALVFRERGSRTVRSPGAEASLRNETDTVDRAVTYRERVVVPGSVSPEYENVETETIAVSGRLRWETEKTDLEQDTLDSWEFGGDSSSPEADAPVTGLTRDGSFENKVTPGG